MKLTAYISQSKNPWFNQAAELTFLDNTLKDRVILLVWQNRESINIGRTQNPWFVCNTRQAKQNRVNIIRRQTAGGALYQDPGHSNFSLLSRTEQLPASAIKTILTRMLELLAVNASINQQNEIVIQNRTVSNTASLTENSNTLIHSAIRVNSNLSAIDEYMTSGNRKPRLNVIDNYSNLCEINSAVTHSKLQNALIKASSEYFGSDADINHIDINPLPPIAGLGERYHRISSWDWNYGQSPNFSRHIEKQFSWGKVTLNLQVIQGTIKQIHCSSNQRFTSLFRRFCEKLTGYPYQAKSVMPVICTLLIDFSSNHTELLEFARWLEYELS